MTNIIKKLIFIAPAILFHYVSFASLPAEQENLIETEILEQKIAVETQEMLERYFNRDYLSDGTAVIQLKPEQIQTESKAEVIHILYSSSDDRDGELVTLQVLSKHEMLSLKEDGMINGKALNYMPFDPPKPNPFDPIPFEPYWPPHLPTM